MRTTTLSWNTDDVTSTSLYKYSSEASWPGVDGVTQSYYQYELGKRILPICMHICILPICIYVCCLYITECVCVSVCSLFLMHGQFWADLHEILLVAFLYPTDGHGG